MPKVLPTSLEILNLAGYGRTPHKFTGGIPSEWGALTNLKELNMAHCSLDGKLLSTRMLSGPVSEQFERLSCVMSSPSSPMFEGSVKPGSLLER